MSEMLSSREAAQYCGIALSTWYKNYRSWAVPFFKIGGKILFEQHDLAAWLESRRDKPVREMTLEEAVMALNAAQADLNYWYYIGPGSAMTDGITIAGERISEIHAHIEQLLGGM